MLNTLRPDIIISPRIHCSSRKKYMRNSATRVNKTVSPPTPTKKQLLSECVIYNMVFM